MSLLQDIKNSLRQTQDLDDAELTRLASSATMEYMRFIGWPDASDGSTLEATEDAINGIILMAKADYEGDPLKREEYRKAAETLWMPYAENDRMGL